MSDGAGEGGFDFEVEGEPLTALPIDDVDIRFTQFEDGVVVPPANPVAIAARNGDADAVREGLSRNPDDANRRFMNSSPLHWAIFGGNEDAVEALLDAGADPNEPDASGSAPILSCIFQGMLDDAKTARLLNLLAKAGADFSIKYGEMSLIECAENRNKTASIAVLRQVVGGKG
jgi:ankyrin repeat protein